MNKRLVAFYLVMALLVIQSTVCSLADERASVVFNSTTVALTNSLYAEFRASTKYICDKIEVSSCTLQEMDSDDRVISNTSLSKPASVSNDDDYQSTMNYNSYGTSGKRYRIKAIFKADGYTTTAYSRIISF